MNEQTDNWIISLLITLGIVVAILLVVINQFSNENKLLKEKNNLITEELNRANSLLRVCQNNQNFQNTDKPITLFEYPENVLVFNENDLITTKEIIGDGIFTTIAIRVKNNQDSLYTNKTLCIEHKFAHIQLRYDKLYRVPSPYNYTFQSLEYKAMCYSLLPIKSYDYITYLFEIEQQVIASNQTVKISIW